jgi:hypothetical protein
MLARQAERAGSVVRSNLTAATSLVQCAVALASLPRPQQNGGAVDGLRRP